jgi:hypothetical protein
LAKSREASGARQVADRCQTETRGGSQALTGEVEAGFGSLVAKRCQTETHGGFQARLGDKVGLRVRLARGAESRSSGSCFIAAEGKTLTPGHRQTQVRFVDVGAPVTDTLPTTGKLAALGGSGQIRADFALGAMVC